MLKLINVDPKYIDYLKEFSQFDRVMNTKFNVSSNGGRKYIGICLVSNNYSYYIPIHKGSKEDAKPSKSHIDKNGIRKIHRSKFDVEFIERDKTGNEHLTSILKTAYMIPIPTSTIIPYNIATEPNPKIKADFQDLMNWCNKPTTIKLITDRSKYLYNTKLMVLNNKITFLKPEEIANSSFWLNYALLEEKCELWEKYPGIKNNLADANDIKKINDHVRHKDNGYNPTMLEGKHFIYNDELYRIDQIALKPLGSDSAILTKLTISGEEKYIDNNFTSDAKFNLHLQKIDSKILSNFKDNKNK